MLARTALLLLVVAVAAPAAGQAPADRAARIEKLIQQLGAEQFDVREAATKALAEIGNPARAALQKAAASTDVETAQRAKTILDKLPKLTHTLVDALGRPIPLASVTVFSGVPQPNAELPPPGEAEMLSTMLTDEEGRLGLPDAEEGQQFSVRVEHQDYGLARCLAQTGKEAIQVPLVRSGSEAARRAASGQVVAANGEPLAGVEIVCSDVRTPGEGLINAVYPRGTVLTGADGRFALYMPNENKERERGDLIPQNSRYALTINVQNDDAYLPLAGRFSNAGPVRIVLPRATQMHRFRFEAAGGGWIEDPEQLRNVRVQLDTLQDGERTLTPLDTDSLVKGRKLLPGKYVAECFFNGKTVQYLPLTITDDSPEQLDFRCVPAVTYAGQVVSGVTGEPASGALVMAYRSSSRNNLALLTADDWKLLAECPSNPPENHSALKRLGDFYGVEGLVRADREGRFSITRAPDREFYGLIAFAENQIPFQVRLYSVKPTGQRADAGKFLLFPAAKAVVKPVFDGQHLAVSPFWLLEKEGQPDWFARFQTAFNGSDRCLEYVHWLQLNEAQPVFVPAGVRLRLRLESPYDDKWTPAAIDALLQLEPGAVRELGEVRFAPSLPVAVRVLNAQGQPVEGFAVRRMYQGENAWCVAHNTDQAGLAHFHVRPNSLGRFRVSDLAGPKDVVQAANLAAEFKVEAAAPAKPFEITVTDEQIKLLRTARGGLPR